MNGPIEIPVKGRLMTAAWGASVAKRLNAIGSVGSARMLLIDGETGTGFEPLPENLRARIRHRPFEVAGSGGEDYKFAIYVPDNVVAIGEEIVTPDGITAIPDTDGWYMLDDESDVSEDGSTLYLVAYDDGSATFTFDLEEAAGESEDDPKILAILPIAELKTQSVGQKTFGVVYRQLACHPFAVSLGGGSSPTPPTEDRYPRHFDINKTVTPQGTVYKVINCQIMCGNQECTCGDYTVNNNGGNIYLHVSRQTGGGYSISVDQHFVAETATSISVMLWEFSLAPVLDVRPGYIPVFAV